MPQGLLALGLGLVGGLLGGLAIGLLMSPASQSSGAESDATPKPDLIARIERLEDEARSQRASVRLQGRPEPGGPSLGSEAAGEEALIERLEARLVERLGPRLDSAVEEKMKTLAEAQGEEGESGRAGRERLPLAEVAQKVGLSGGEEDDLRAIYAESQQKFLEIMAKPDGDVEAVRRDWDSFREDESQRPVLMAKYVPKLVGNLADVIGLQAEKETRIREAVGDEKADRLKEYDIVEENPFGMNASVGVTARGD